MSGFKYNSQWQTIALGYSITRKAIDDTLYKGDFNIKYLGGQALDPAFSLDELEAAQATIDAITKK